MPYFQLPENAEEDKARINFNTLSHYLPRLEHITHQAAIAQVYTYTDKSGWEETSIKGPLFIARLHPLPQEDVFRYVVFIINRQHFTNWVCHIHDSISIVDNGETIILSNPLPVPDARDSIDSTYGISLGNDPIECFGLWVYAEKETTVAAERRKIFSELQNAQVFAEGMKMASRRRDQERQFGRVVPSAAREPFDEAAEFLRWMEGDGEDDPNCPY